MNKAVLLILILLPGLVSAQAFNWKDLVGFTDLSVQKFDAQVSKKDFKRDYFSPRETNNSYTYFQVKKSKKSDVNRSLLFQSAEQKTLVGYQTTSLTEFANLVGHMKHEGFKCYQPVDSVSSHPVLYQKENLLVYTSMEIKDTLTFYSLVIEKKNLSKSRDIIFAEDLLILDSHEYLVAVFGSQNVVKDVFYYTENETNKCSVLFPNTNREVIFIWDDEVNYRGIAFMAIGGGLLTKKDAGFNQPLEHNIWRSKQGIYSGMNLMELQELNGQDLNFYGWHLDQAGMLAPRNSGLIDFKRIGVVLSCLNCSDKQYWVNVVKSSDALAENRKIYVSTIIILPEKERAASVSKAH